MKEFKPGLHVTAYTTCLRDMTPAPVEPVFDPAAFEAIEMEPPKDLTDAHPSYDGFPVRLKQAIAGAAVPLAVAVFFLTMYQSGDASAWLACSIGLPALGLALIGAVAPWAVKR